jgi:fermentation-respiration switch protein FrsA (DUF1100 family)
MLLSAAGILLSLLVAAAALLFLFQDRLLYFPQRTLDARPADYGLAAEDFVVQTRDGVRLLGWWIRGRGETVLIFFQGNAGNASHRLERARGLVSTLGTDVVLVDYRGYGESGGNPSESGLYRDGEAIWDAVEAKGVPPERVVLFGESLGCAVALETALRRSCRAVILEAPFLSVPEMVKRLYPFVPPFLVRTRMDNGSRISRLACPKLIVQAERDEIVPPEQTRRLFALSAVPKEYFVIPGAHHNDTDRVGGRVYLEVLRRFLDGVPSPMPNKR